MNQNSTQFRTQGAVNGNLQPAPKKSWSTWMLTTFAILLMTAGSNMSWGQTAFNMSSGNYSANFADIASWSANFTSGIGAINFSSVAIGAGSGAANNVTAGTRTTKSSATFVTSSTGGIQKGTQAFQFLSTGSTATPEAVAVDLLLDFTGRNAGTLSFDWAAIDNASGTRPTTLRVFYSIDNITFTEITTAQVLDQVSPTTGTITSIALPAALNNVATARIRFYNHAGSTTIGTGGRDKMQIDNISITSTSSIAAAPIITSSTTTTNTIVLSPYAGYTITASNSPTSFSATGLPSGLSVNTTTGSISGTPSTGSVNTYTVTASASNATGAGTATFLLNVNKANQTITFGSLANKVVADPAITLGATSTSGLAISYATTNASVAAVSGNSLSFPGAGTATITASQAGNVDYNAATDVAQAQVVSAAALTNQTITFTLASPVTYGVTPITLNGTGGASGNAVTYTSNNSIASISGNTLTINGVGTATITASQAGNASYNAAADVTQVITVNQKGISITGASASNKVYDGVTAATITGATLSGIVGADVVTLSTPTATFASANAGTAIAVTTNYSLTGANASNYSLTAQPSLSANITQATPTINFATLSNIGIGATATLAATSTPPGLAITYASSNASIASLATNIATGVAIGTATITASFAGDANYTAASATQPITVAALPTLIAAWDFQTTTNGGTATVVSPNTPLSYTANVGTGSLKLDGTNGSSLWLQASELNSFGGSSLNVGAGMSSVTSGVTSLALLGGTANSANTKAIVFNVNMSAYNNLVISYATQGSASGFTTQTWEYSTNGTSWNPLFVKTGITTSFVLVNIPATSALDGIATAYVRLTFTGATNATGNNRIDNIQFNASAAVAAAPVITSATTTQNTTVLSAYAGYTITASNSPTSFSATGLPSGLSVNTTTGIISGTPSTGSVNTYTITASASNATGAGTATFLLNVNKANQTITFGALANKVVADPAITLGATSTSGLAISYATSNASVAAVSGNSLSFPAAGTATISASQAGNVDYNAATDVAQSQVVTSAALTNQTITFTLASPVTYGVTPITLNGTGGASGNAVTYTSNNSIASISGNTLTINGVGTATITASQAGNASYNAAADVTQVITVNAKSLTVSGASADNKIYDKTNVATISGSTLVGVVGADVVTISNSGIFTTVNVGTGIVVTSTQVLSGADAAKYTLVLPTSLSANITPKAITIGAAGAANKTFDGNTTATITGTLTGVVATDVVTLALSGTFASSAIGTAIAVTSTSTIGGTDAGNYTLTQPTGLTANISAAAATLLTWNTFGNTGTETTEPSTTNNVNISAADLNYTGSTVTPTANVNRFGANNWVIGALNTAKYIQFTVTPNAGFSFTPTSFDFIWDFSGSGPKSVALRSSVDNYTADLGVITNMTTSTSTIRSIAISSLTNIATTTTFKLYGYDATGTGGTGGFDCAASANNVILNGTTASTGTSVISTTGTLSALTTVYGTASTETTFSVSGASMSAGILVTPPAGFEVSLTSGSGFASTVTVGAAGTIAATNVYVRLAASTLVGTYAGNIILSSIGATAVNVATASSTVTANSIPITALTANNKVFDGNTTATLSGTPTLIGVIPGDAPNVILGGTPVATFASSAIGNNIAVSVTGFTISGSAASNYILVQPSLTANITATATPTITSTLTASGIYGTPITNYIITGTATPTSFSATGLPSGVTVNTTTGIISGTPIVVGTYSVTIAATNASGSGSAILVYTINAKQVTVSGASADNKVYDKTNVATISGSTLVGVVGTDVVTISNSGIFATVNVGTGIVVTSTQTLGGADAAKYVLVLPTGLSANINPKVLSIGAASANDKSFDGTNVATLTGTLTGVVATDIVTLALSGTFASTAIGSSIAVTSTSTIGGSDAGNYTLTQPTGLTASILSGPSILAVGDISIIGFNLNTPDNFAFATWVDISPNTFIKFTDNAFLSASSATAAGNARGGENFIIWKSGTSVIPAGTVISVADNTTAGITSNGSIISGNLNGLSASGDNIFAYQGAATTGANPDWTANANPTTFNGTILFGLYASGSSAVNTWLTTGIASSNTSYLPSQLNVSGGNIALGALSTRGQFTGSRSNQPSYANYKAIVTNPSNWTLGTSTGVAILDLTAFTLGTTAPPAITATGTLFALTTIYGTASTETSFSVSGTDMTAGILVTPPAGYEVSLTSGSGFASTVTVGAAGTIAATNVYVRLAATTAVGTYVGDIVLSSVSATAVNVATASSTVTTATISITGITANNKLFDGNTTATVIGTPTLVGVLAGDVANVILGGIPVATFASSAIGTGIAVSVTGFTISGSAAGNYNVAQPIGLTANITATATPSITSTLTATGIYGTPITNYTITATATPTSYTATGLPAGLSVNTTTGIISGTPTVVGNYSVTIAAANAGGSGSATLVYTINAKQVTVSGASADNKVYDKTNAATISGSTLVGVVGTDVVTISNSGIFATVNVGTGIVVTSTQTLGGADAAKYVLVLPTSLSANITPKAITIGAAGANNKTFDGTNVATITGTLSGVVATDVVTLTLSGVFASSAIGTGIAVTSTSTIGGADAGNYTLTQPTGLVANIIGAPVLTEIIFPQFIQGLNGTNNNRIPFAYRATVSNLSANATYRFYNSVELTSALPSSTGAGNNIYTGANQAANFTYSTGPSLNTSGNYGTFTTDANGAYTGWFIIAPTGNATRFVPGTLLNTRIVLNDGNNGTTVTSVVKSTNTIQVINTVGSTGANNGTGLRGNSFAADKNFVFVYDNVAGTGRPLSGTFVENNGAAEVASFATFYTASVNAVSGAYGMIIPNTNANGVQRIEQRDFATGAIVGCPATDADGNWPSGANTVNPIGGTTAIVITNTDAKLNATCTPNTNLITAAVCTAALPYIWNGNNYSASGSYTFTTVNACGCDSVVTLTLTVNNPTSSNIIISSATPYTWAANGTIYSVSGIYYNATTNANGCAQNDTLQLTITTSSTATLNTKLFLQGYWNGTNMVAARYDNLVAAGSATPGNATDVDEVTIELHNATTYALVYTATGILQTNGSLTVTFPSAAIGNNYYIVIKHQSALQLWSASPITIATSTSYDFSDDVNNAYTDGSNPPMALLAPGVYGLYTGDVNGDEFIDAADLNVFELDVENSSLLGLFNLPSDFNGDTYVDAADYSIFDYYSTLGLYSQHP
jgi:hypothetical protein